MKVFARRLCLLGSTLPLFFPAHAFASGFEKTNMVSAKLTGYASAAASSVEGAESVFYNPAGLARTRGLDISLDSAIGFPSVSAPVTSTTPVSSGFTAIPIGGLFVAHQVLNNLGIGLGLFVSGGVGANYGNVDFGASYPALKPEFNSLFGLAETSLGAGYEPVDGLRLGAAWRILIVRASSKAAGILPGGALLATQFTDASGTSFTGFRFGAQYSPRDASWGLGATLRTSVDFKAQGKSAGSIEAAGGTTASPITGGDVTLSSTFPFQFSLGGHEAITSSVKLFEEYTFTRNTTIHGLNTSGTALGLGGGASLAVENLSAPTNWRNLHQIRIGSEWQAAERLALRAGYVLSSQVVPNELASPFFTPPGMDHTFTAGAGTSVLNGTTHLDAALEYETCAGTVSGSSLPVHDGDYTYRVFAVYTQISRSF